MYIGKVLALVRLRTLKVLIALGFLDVAGPSDLLVLGHPKIPWIESRARADNYFRDLHQIGIADRLSRV
jgi:hypothetical protein